MELRFAKEREELTDNDRAVFLDITMGDTDEIVVSEDEIKEVRIGRGKDKKTKTNRRELIWLLRRAVMLARTRGVKSLAVSLPDLPLWSQNISEAELAELVATEIGIANYEFTHYKKAPKTGWPLLECLTLIGSKTASKIKAERGLAIARVVNDARDLINTPANDLFPAELARRARMQMKGRSVRVTEIDAPGLTKIGAGGILAVGKGSVHEPRLIVLEYSGGKKTDKPIVLAGKGITHDTGGYSIKPFESMITMHMDMSGGAAVIGALRLAAELKLKKNVVGIIAAAENMISGGSVREGDILRMLDGTTVEVRNTDAEGRLVLADALSYAKRYNPKAVVDIATLTGGVIIALGYRFAGLFTPEERLRRLALVAGEVTGEYLWPLPIGEEFDNDMKSAYADISNMSKVSRSASATMGAVFLKHFAKGYPWLHIDMAGRMDSQEHDCLAKGALGFGVQLLLKLVETI